MTTNSQNDNANSCANININDDLPIYILTALLLSTVAAQNLMRVSAETDSINPRSNYIVWVFRQNLSKFNHHLIEISSVLDMDPSSNFELIGLVWRIYRVPFNIKIKMKAIM